MQDLKGNIRVYCRVRPVSAAEAADPAHDSEMSLDFPTSGDLLGRGLSVVVPGNLTGQAPQVKAGRAALICLHVHRSRRPQ